MKEQFESQNTDPDTETLGPSQFPTLDETRDAPTEEAVATMRQDLAARYKRLAAQPHHRTRPLPPEKMQIRFIRFDPFE